MTPPSRDAWTLPWRGLGLSSNLGASDVPHPYRLLEAHPGLFDYVEYSAPLSLDEARAQASLFPEMWKRRADVPVLFHPVHLNLWGPELEPVEALANLDAHARAVESPWVGNDVGWWHAGGQPFPGYLYFTPPFNEEGLADCVAHALHTQAHLSMPLALENPAVLARRGAWHVLDFMAKLHARTGLPLLLDLGHLYSHQLAAGLPLDAGLDGFPLDRVIEIHLAGGVVTRRGSRQFYVDDHTQPVREELFGLLESLLPRCPALRAVTFEGDGHPPEVALLSLRRLRALVPAGQRPPLVFPRPHTADGAPFAESSRASAVSSSPHTADEASLTEGNRSAHVPSSPRTTDDALLTGAPHPSVVPPAQFRIDVPPLTGASSPWSFFDAGHGAAPVASVEDEAGTVADKDFRLAVIAEALDKDWPLSRLLLAGTGAALEGFTASPEYRGLFSNPSRVLGQAFAAWARRQLREHPDEGAAAALSLELFLPSAFARPVPAPGPGQLGLAEDVRPAVFPVDLTELVFAARAVRRHLTARAWVCEAVELSGLESLVQVSRRPAPGPWHFLVRRRPGGGHEVRSASPALTEVVRKLASRPLLEADVPPALRAEAEAHGWLRRG